MKKHVSILLGLMVIFSSLFTSCNNEDELDPNICKITVNSEGNGTVAITDYIGTSVNVLIGNQVEVVATPDDGWAFIGWYISGTEAPASTDAAFTFITSEDVTLTARFAKLSDIIIRSGGNGSVAFKNTSGNSIPVLPGSEVTVIARPNKDCDFVGWFVGDSETPVSTETEYTFTVTENIILTGQFSKRPIVTVQSTGNGSVSIKDAYGTTKAFLPDTEVTIIAKPYENCDFIGWFVTNEESPISTDAEYTFTVTKDVTLIAKFSKRPIVTIRSAGNGSVTFKDHDGNSIAVLPDTEVTVIATPDENCDFVGWFVSDEKSPISTDAEYNFTVSEDVTLTAKFSKHPIVTIYSVGYGSVSFKDHDGTSIVVLPDTEVTVIATPDENCDFIGWFIGNSLVGTEQNLVYNVSNDVVLIAKFHKEGENEYVSIFNFTNPESLTPSVKRATIEANPTQGAGVEFDEITFTNGNVSVKVSQSDATTPVRLWTRTTGDVELRTYKNSTITICTIDGCEISSIVFEGNKVSTMSASTGSFNAGTWNGKASTVTFSVTGTLNIKKLTTKIPIEF